jgi:hypothetical protein
MFFLTAKSVNVTFILVYMANSHITVCKMQNINLSLAAVLGELTGIT